MKNNNFSCVKMTRDIRNKLYEQNKGKTLGKFANILVEDAHKSLLWKKVKLLEFGKSVEVLGHNTN